MNQLFVVIMKTYLACLLGSLVLLCGSCCSSCPTSEVTPSSVNPTFTKESNVIATFVANGTVYYDYLSTAQDFASTISFVYLLMANNDVVIIEPTLPKNSNIKPVCVPPFSKEEAKVLLEAQLGRKPNMRYSY